MMQKLMSYKKIIICACAAVAVIAVAAVVLLSNKEEAYRSILVYDVEGNAVIERKNVGSMNAAENLYLESGDRVSVASESSMRMKLDGDKYVMAEADTIFSVEAKGTEADSKTKITLEQGAITNEIQNPLQEGASFETSTPNSVMAVRGTIYRVELYVDENGDQNTKLCCFQGKVGTKSILPDGTYGEEISVPAGSELIVHQDGTMDDVRDIAYDELPEQAIQNLVDMLENGQSMIGISLEDLTQPTLETEDFSEAAESEIEQADQPSTEEVVSESEVEKKADAQIHTTTDTAKKTIPQPVKEEQNTPTPQPPAPAPQPPKPENSGEVDHSNTGEEDSQDEDPDSDDDRPDEDQPDQPEKENPSKPETYKVTFMYQGKVFATQKVKRGKKVTAPTLNPAESGAWDFDFETKIKANTTISWK